MNASGDIYVTDLNNKKVQVLREHEKFSRSFGHDVLSTPCGICTDTSRRIYVADRTYNRILLFSSKGKFIEEIELEEELNEPCGISLDPE